MSRPPEQPRQESAAGPTYRHAPRGGRTAIVVLSALGLGAATMLVLLALGRGVEPQPTVLRVVFGLVGAVIALGALSLLRALRHAGRSGFDVGPSGIEIRAGSITEQVGWSEVAAVRFRVYLDRAVTPVDLVDRQSYPRLELAFHDSDASEAAHPLLRRLRSAGTTAEGYTHGLDVGIGPFFPRDGVERHLPELQQVLWAVAGPAYQGASVEKRWFGSRRR